MHHVTSDHEHSHCRFFQVDPIFVVLQSEIVTKATRLLKIKSPINTQFTLVIGTFGQNYSALLF